MRTGVRTKLRRLRSGSYTNDDYYEIRELAALLHAGAVPLDRPVPEADASLEVAFVVPSFKPGSGGHMTIANIVRGLERRGHTCSLWIDDPGRRMDAEAPAQLREWFGPFDAQVRYGFDDWSGADVVLATGWQTVARALSLGGAAGRAYLVQDHEPEFFGTSAQRHYADDSYRHGLHAITAGTWLADLMHDSYGMSATPFDLGVNPDVYATQAIHRHDNVVLFYARASTPRRAVPIALAGLGELVARRPDVEVWGFGYGIEPGVDFAVNHLGVLSEPELAQYYNAATVGLVLSMTNYSLVAQEMLACGLACVELDSPSVVAAYGRDGPVDLAPPDPYAIASALERLLDDLPLRAERVRAGLEFAATRTWDRAAEQVEAGLRAALAR